MSSYLKCKLCRKSRGVRDSPPLPRTLRRSVCIKPLKYAACMQTSICAVQQTSGLCRDGPFWKTPLLAEGKQHKQPINKLICTPLVNSVSQEMDGSTMGGLRGTPRSSSEQRCPMFSSTRGYSIFPSCCLLFKFASFLLFSSLLTLPAVSPPSLSPSQVSPASCLLMLGDPGEWAQGAFGLFRHAQLLHIFILTVHLQTRVRMLCPKPA